MECDKLKMNFMQIQYDLTSVHFHFFISKWIYFENIFEFINENFQSKITKLGILQTRISHRHYETVLT